MLQQDEALHLGRQFLPSNTTIINLIHASGYLSFMQWCPCAAVLGVSMESFYLAIDLTQRFSFSSFYIYTGIHLHLPLRMVIHLRKYCEDYSGSVDTGLVCL